MTETIESNPEVAVGNEAQTTKEVIAKAMYSTAISAVASMRADGKTERGQQSRMSVYEREAAIAYLTQDVIAHPMHESCISSIASMHAARKSNGKTPRGMLITGLTGSGKSTIGKGYAEGYPRREEDERTVIPVLYVELPGQPSAKVIAERILNKMGDPYAERGGAEQKLHRVRRLLSECRVELVIIDEFNHITDNLDGRTRDIAADTLKNLMNESCVPFLFLGGPSCRGYFVKNQQLGRRCTPKVPLRPFGLTTDAERRDFQRLLKALEQRLPFSQPSALVQVATVRPIWFASFGLIGQLTQLVAAALDFALKDGADTLTAEHLSRGFSGTIYTRCSPSRNPFHEKFNDLPLTAAGEPFHGFEA